MFGKIFSVVAASLALASAYTTPVGNPSGNPITKPSLNEVVPAGQPYTITWTPTTTGPVTILLLKGPSTNVVPLYPIASSIDNSGSFVWTPATDLQPTGNSGYGLQLIVDATGQYQYSTQFGISNPSYSAGSNSTASGSTSSPTGAPSNGTMTASSTMTSSGSAASGTAMSNFTMTTMSAAASSTTASVQVQTSSPSATGSSSSGAGSLVASFGSAFVAVAAAVMAL